MGVPATFRFGSRLRRSRLRRLNRLRLLSRLRWRISRRGLLRNWINGSADRHTGIRRAVFRWPTRRGGRWWCRIAGGNFLTRRGTGHRSRRQADELHGMLREVGGRRRRRRRRETRRVTRAKQIRRNGDGILAMRASHLVPRHLRRDLKSSATNGATKLRQMGGSFLRILRRISRRRILLRRIRRRKASGRISHLLFRGVTGVESSRQPKKFRRRQHHHALTQRTADLLPSISRIDLDRARTKGALHRHGIHGAKRAERGRLG